MDTPALDAMVAVFRRSAGRKNPTGYEGGWSVRSSASSVIAERGAHRVTHKRATIDRLSNRAGHPEQLPLS